MIAPATNPAMVFQFHSFISFDTNQVEAKTKPKKNDHTNTGWATNSQVMTFANENTLIPIPKRIEKRKLA